jgi:hypothetical protein
VNVVDQTQGEKDIPWGQMRRYPLRFFLRFAFLTANARERLTLLYKKTIGK